ncbi:MAG: hypothetical protein JXA78_12095 [Anaerolineales bacterium]|nr:hypothetical protein [Anaerolineales bacterium]
MNIFLIVTIIFALTVVMIMSGRGGGKIALKTKPKSLKTISGILTIVAAMLMLSNALSGK